MPYLTQQLPRYSSDATQDDEAIATALATGRAPGGIAAGHGRHRIQGEMRMGFIQQSGPVGEYDLTIPGYIPAEDSSRPTHPVSVLLCVMSFLPFSLDGGRRDTHQV